MTFNGEDSSRGDYVTEMVTLWLANEGDVINYYGDHGRIAEIAAKHAWAGDLEWLAKFATYLIRWTRTSQAAWDVQQELAPNDYDRIRWADVAAELKATFEQDGLN